MRPQRTQGWEYRWFLPLTGTDADFSMTKVPGARTYDSMPEVRTDVYIAARDDVGVKVAGRSRGKRIEVKVRACQHSTLYL